MAFVRGLLACALSLALTALGLGLDVATAPPARAATATPTAVEVELTRLVNAERARHGLPGLTVDVRLVASARRWSEHQAARGALGHDPALPSGLPAGVTSWAENVAMTGASGDAAAALHQMFMGSAGHRGAVLSSAYTEVGIGVAVASGNTYVTQRFTSGARARVAPAVDGIAALAEQHFAGRAEHAVITRDDVYADALAAGPLAGRSGPILLTPRGPALHPRARLALERTLPRGATVWIVGGTAAVSSKVEAELRSAGWAPSRVGGADRFETAAMLGRELAKRHGPPDTVLVATGSDWADAAAGGAYGARRGTPVLLTEAGHVPTPTARALADLRPTRVAALGGTAVLSDRVVAALGAERVAGATRQETSARIAESLWGFADSGPTRWVATPAFGDDAWTWSLGAAPAAARLGAPVLLLGEDVPREVRRYLSDLGYGGATTADLVTVGPVPSSGADIVRSLLR